MGRCITIITLTGATSLGLLTGSLAYQSLQGIPELIRQLNAQVSLKSESAGPVLAAVRKNLTVSNALTAVFGALSTWLFSTAYKHSSAAGKHPFLIYSAATAPVALAVFWGLSGTKACGVSGPFGGADVEIVKRRVLEVAQLACEKWATLKCRAAAAITGETTKSVEKSEGPQESETKAAGEEAAKKDADDHLGASYIHVTDDASSDSSPETPVEAVESVVSNIESEVDDILAKKERVQDLETVAAAYKVASVVASVGFAISAIGVIGDQFFL